jgi:[acyl-carrier-protein] S-malonyltransferase
MEMRRVEEKVALMFPGQGAQYVGMAKSLCEAYDRARMLVERADRVLGTELSRIMFHGPPVELTLTKNTQPAIFLHSAVVLEVLEEFGFTVGAACGHSLGEYSALYAGGSLSFEDAIWLVRERGLLMYESGMKRAGTMAAVMGLDVPVIEQLCAESSGPGVVVPANFNCPGQIVISGDVEAVRRAMERARRAGAQRVVELDVSGAFHSPLMEDASEGLAERLSRVHIRDARFPVISNAGAEPVTAGEDIRAALIAQLTRPVRWEDSMRRLLSMGFVAFIELGPGRVLSGLLKRVDRSVKLLNVDTVEDLAKIRTGVGA